ncbi:MAG: hypothetical protein DGJ47_000408 [Rickettsiaceae bacterium]
MSIYIISGENSGDLIGAKLIESLNTLGGEMVVNGIGGPLMTKQGLKSLFPISEINIMGFFEIIPHLFRINQLINNTVDDIIKKGSKILVTIDCPGFTYRVAQRVKKRNPDIKLVHIVAPSVWAWRPGRAKKYAKLYDHLLTLFPFENKYFTKVGLDTTCIGHPIFQQKFHKKSIAIRKIFTNDSDTRVITITPGSRIGEIQKHMPIIVDAINQLSLKHRIKVLFVQPNNTLKKCITTFLQDVRFNFTYTTDRLKAFAASDCAIAKSGTNTFEIIASGTPMAVGYKVNWLSFYLIKMMIRIKYACLINIIPNKPIIPEFLQDDFNKKNLLNIIEKMLSDQNYVNKQLESSHKVLSSIGFNNTQKPSDIAAKTILKLIR